MSDKIEEIRERHELVGGSGSVIHPTGFSWTIPGWVAHADRATLLAEVDRLRAEIERLRENVDRAGKEVERADRLRAEIARVKADDKKSREKNEKLRAAMTDMLAGWRYIRDTYGDLAGVGWDRVEQKARNALEGKP